MDLAHSWRWLRFNLFAKPFDTVLTLIVVPSLLWATTSFVHWVFVLADWTVVQTSAKVLMTGLFPGDQLWRAWIATALIGVMFGVTSGTAMPLQRKRMVTAFCGLLLLVALATTVSVEAGLKTFATAAVFLVTWGVATKLPVLRTLTGPIAIALLALVVILLVPVGPSTWGGLLLSVLLTIFAAALTIPLGVLLAFGRQSKIASIRILCTGYIEVMRAVPLILIVYLIWITLPLLLPSVPVPDVVRGLLGFVIFYCAYAAEYIRSGLQAVSRGQVEAAEALGFSDGDIKRMIVLPQAMRVAVPGLVGNVLDIFNYAPLVFIIGLTDFLRSGQMILANPQNSDQTYEIYVFLFVVYFTIGSVITFMARRLEQHLGKGS